MIQGARWLGLEVKYLDRAVSFYEAFLDLSVTERTDRAAWLDAGAMAIVLRTPGPPPRGGLHTHYALGVPAASYDRWYDRLDQRFDLVERTFGDARSLYFYDTEGNCVELGEGRLEGQVESDDQDAADSVLGCFEVVLEVADLEAAQAFYEALGFSETSVGEERRRELWEPQLGIADARGGVHVDLGLAVDDPDAVADAVADRVRARESVDDGVRVQDPDGHWLTLVGQ